MGYNGDVIGDLTSLIWGPEPVICEQSATSGGVGALVADSLYVRGPCHYSAGILQAG